MINDKIRMTKEVPMPINEYRRAEEAAKSYLFSVICHSLVISASSFVIFL